MKSIINSLNIFKKQSIKIFIAQALFFYLNFLFLIFVRNKQLNFINESQNLLSNPELIDHLSGLTNKAMVFDLLVVPLIFLSIWCFFQSIIWKYAKDEKPFVNYKSYILKFSIVTFIVFLVYALLLFPSIGNTTDFYELNISIWQLLILTFLMLYFLTLYYIKLDKESLFKTLKSTFLIGFKKFHRLIFPFMLYFIVTLVLLFLYSVLFVSKISENHFYLGPLVLFFSILITIVVSAFFKVYLTDLVKSL